MPRCARPTNGPDRFENPSASQRHTASYSTHTQLMLKMQKYNDAARIKFKPRSWLPWG